MRCRQNLEIAPARMEDKDALEALQMRASLVWEEYRTALGLHPEAVTVPSQQIADGGVLVAREGRRAIGFVALEPRGAGEAELDGLFVEPALWGRRIGSRLLEAAAALARERGCEQLAVIANPRAEGFYRRCGFQRLGEAETPFGVAIRMVRRLG